MADRARSRSPRRDRDKPNTGNRDNRDYEQRDSGRREDRDRRDDNTDRSRDNRDRDHRDHRDRNDDRPRPRKKKTGGFNFKDSRRDNDRDDQDSGDRRGGSSYRGYRNRSPSPRRSKPSNNDSSAATSSKKEDTTKPPKRPAAAGSSADTTKPPKRAPAAAASGGPGMEMIIVHVNDRLGTKAAIPCLPSDTIRQFKIIVAARIGREPHEILLKRQGQRPFKDMLSLADYEISNGVQLDLEVDTGD
ncbi:hypothetical protein PG990_003358 [Apiospora arundinis]|uniref:Ubiquitin-like modifier HUB1 n=1 Tax=Apiospora arundinis TaxID=335852 RepID=A0ABR2IHG2_9PEZI